MKSIVPYKNPVIITICFAVIHVILFAWFSSYTAEDAFIVYRYSENLIHGAGLVFNPGEYVTALTSPLHALVVSVLYGITGSSLWSNRILALILHFSAGGYALHVLQIPKGRFLYGLFVWCSPFVVFWTAGGLETMYLASFLVTAYAAAYRCVRQYSPRHQLLFSICLGLAFLTRYDSCLVTLPMWFHVVWKQYQHKPQKSLGSVRTLLLPGLFIAGGWFIFSYIYYHDIFPTSVYHKPLQWDTQRAAVRYMVQFGLFCGILPVLGWWVIDQVARPDISLIRTIKRTVKSNVGILLGFALLSIYASTSILLHMMFANRMLVPYLPIATLLLIQLINATGESVWQGGRFGRWSWPIVTTLAISTQTTLFIYIDQVSINPGRYGEYTSLSRQSYVEFIDLLERQAEIIDTHWQAEGKERAPQVHVYAAGILPYKLPHAKIVDWGLMSYRKHVHVDRVQTGVLYSSDYIITLTPRHDTRRLQLQREPTSLKLITESTLEFDGKTEAFGVYYNSAPSQYRLPNYVDGQPLDEIPVRME